MADYKKMSRAELLDALHQLESLHPKPEEDRDLSTLVEELHIHQVELEMQNHELQEAHVARESALERYQALFDFAPVALLTIDTNGAIYELNQAAQELLGVSGREAVGKRFSTFVAPGHVRVFLAHHRQVLQARTQLMTELPLSVRGSEITVQVFSSTVTFPNDPERLCRSALVDVTERRKVERQLQESEERYRRLFYPISDAVLLVDQRSETVIDNNAAAITLYGYPARQLIGTKLSTLFVDPERCQALLQNTSRTTTVLSQRKEDGSIFPAEISVYRFIHRGLLVAGVTVRDLTGQRDKEEFRRKQEEEFRNAIRNVPAFLTFYDKDRRYRFVNKTAESWLQQTAGALEGRTDEERVPENVRQQYRSILLEAYNTKSTQSGRCVFQTPGGPVEVTMKFTPILDENGQIEQVVGVGWEAREG